MENKPGLVDRFFNLFKTPKPQEKSVSEPQVASKKVVGKPILSPFAQRIADQNAGQSGGAEVPVIPTATTDAERNAALQARNEQIAKTGAEGISQAGGAAGSGNVQGEVTGGPTETKKPGYNPSS